MKKSKLQKLNSSHESAIIQLQNDKKNEAGSKKQMKDRGSGKFRAEEVFREISEDDSSALLIDEWPVQTSKEEFIIRSVTVLKWNDEDWHVAHTFCFEDRDHDGSLQIKNQELVATLAKKAASLKQSRDLIKKIQDQLLHQEKLASLGQLAAGIAHEIKNPLNFINNFSELSKEYLSEIFKNLEQMEKNSVSEEVMALLQDIQVNLERIHDHSSRVDRIVRSMLMHSRGESENKEMTDLNALVKEYVNLSFHGMRANRHPINVDIQLDFDEKIMPLNINPEGFSRVILNLCNNAFDAMREKVIIEENAKMALAGNSQDLSRGRYIPKLKISTKQKGDAVNIIIEDNGPGVAKEIKDKLMMPFFTTKRAKEGTGLGLSITQGIVKEHHGRINISTKENEYTRFSISLPILDDKEK